MIHPDMATMLVVRRDRRADRAPRCCATLAREIADVSFNCATVDGDTSTNDSFVLAATGTRADARRSRAPTIRALAPLRAARRPRSPSRSRRRSCATAKARPSSSPIRVEGGRDVAECRRIAFAHRAFAARQDRVLRLRPEPRPHRLRDRQRRGAPISIRRACRSGSTTCSSSSAAARAASYREEDGQRVMKQDEITVRVDARPRRRRRRPSGPATSRTTTSRSTPTTGADVRLGDANSAALFARARRHARARRSACCRRRAADPTGSAHRVPLAQARGPRLPAGGRASARDPPRRSRRDRRAEARDRRATRGSSSPACRRTTCCSPARAAPASRRWSRRCSPSTRRKGLRLIEVDKADLVDLPDIVDRVAGAPRALHRVLRRPHVRRRRARLQGAQGDARRLDRRRRRRTC